MATESYEERGDEIEKHIYYWVSQQVTSNDNKEEGKCVSGYS
jgi:hypothetical protein